MPRKRKRTRSSPEVKKGEETDEAIPKKKVSFLLPNSQDLAYTAVRVNQDDEGESSHSSSLSEKTLVKEEEDENDNSEREDDTSETEEIPGIRLTGLNSVLWILEMGSSMAMIGLRFLFHILFESLEQPNFEATGLELILPFTYIFQFCMGITMKIFFNKGNETMLLISLWGYIYGSVFLILCNVTFFAVLFATTDLANMNEFSGYEKLQFYYAPCGCWLRLQRIMLASTFIEEIVEHRKHDTPHKDCEHCHMQYAPGLSYEEWMERDWD